MKVIKNIKIYTGKDIIENGYIKFTDKIQEIGTMEKLIVNDEEIIDGTDQLIIPGMIDIHIHGGYDIDTMDGNSETIVALGDKLLEEGVTTFFPTTMTQSIDAINKALIACKDAYEKSDIIGGVHLEGPFINKEWKGAQPEEFVMAPDSIQFTKWNNLSGNHISLVTYAPEVEDAKELENVLTELNIVGSSGHTGAYYKDFQDRNVLHATHLYNQMRGLHHREPGVVGYALMTPGVKTEIITDGIHIHPEMVKFAYRMKGAKDLCVITDAMRAKGLVDGQYELGGQPVFVKNNKATLEDGTLAGSVLKMDDAFRNVIQFTGCSIEEAVLMTSVNQAEEFGLHKKGELQIGKDADFVIMDYNLQIVNTIKLGKLLK